MKLSNPYRITDRITLDLRDSKGRYSSPSKAKFFILYVDNVPYFADEFDRVGLSIREKEDIVNEYLIEILSELSPFSEEYEPTFDYDKEDFEEPEVYPGLYDIDYFDDILEKHIKLAPKEKWIFKESEILTDIYGKNKYNKDFVLIPVSLPKNDVYSSIAEYRTYIDTLNRIVRPTIKNIIKIKDAVEIDSYDELFKFIPLLDNLIYIHGLKAQKQMGSVVLESIYPVVKYAIFDDDGLVEEKYISFKKSENGGLINSIGQFASEQAAGIVIDKENEKTLLRYLQGFDTNDQNRLYRKHKQQLYISIEELIITYSFGNYENDTIRHGDVEEINDRRNEITLDVYKQLRKSK